MLYVTFKCPVFTPIEPCVSGSRSLTVCVPLCVCCAAAGVKVHDPRGQTAQTCLCMSQGSQAIWLPHQHITWFPWKPHWKSHLSNNCKWEVSIWHPTTQIIHCLMKVQNKQEQQTDLSSLILYLCFSLLLTLSFPLSMFIWSAVRLRERVTDLKRTINLKGVTARSCMRLCVRVSD